MIIALDFDTDAGPLLLELWFCKRIQHQPTSSMSMNMSASRLCDFLFANILLHRRFYDVMIQICGPGWCEAQVASGLRSEYRPQRVLTEGWFRLRGSGSGIWASAV